LLKVVASLIEHDGRLLACQRRKGDSFALCWEFPGGKMRANETPAAALARELKEELGVAAEIGPELYRTRHQYQESAEELELIFLAARVDPGAIRNLAFEQMRWVAPAGLPQLNFLPADRELIIKLASGELHLE
jgi:8-oxo-dGTP diphosphatase